VLAPTQPSYLRMAELATVLLPLPPPSPPVLLPASPPPSYATPPPALTAALAATALAAAALAAASLAAAAALQHAAALALSPSQDSAQATAQTHQALSEPPRGALPRSPPG